MEYSSSVSPSSKDVTGRRVLSQPLSYQRNSAKGWGSRPAADDVAGFRGLKKGRRDSGGGGGDLPPVFPHVWNLAFGWTVPPRRNLGVSRGIVDGGELGIGNEEVGKVGDLNRTSGAGGETRGRRVIDVLVESECASFEALERYLCRRESSDSSAAEVKFAFLDLNEGVGKEGVDDSMLAQGMNFVSLYQESCYHSCVSSMTDGPIIEIRYNAGEDLSFSADRGIETPTAKDIHIHREATPIFFRYDFKSKSCVYALRNDVFNILASITEIAELCEVYDIAIHPMTCHLVIVHDVINHRDAGMQRIMKGLLAIESQLLDGSLIGMKALGQFRKYTQDLHDLSRELIIMEHYNDRDLATVRILLKDLEKIERRAKGMGKEFEVDEEATERTRAGFECLDDWCVDRARRLLNRKQRVQNLIALASSSHPHETHLTRYNSSTT